MEKRYHELTEHEEDLFNIIKRNHDLLGYICSYVIKDIIQIDGGKRKVYCINYFSKKHKQFVQTKEYKLSELNTILRKEKLEIIDKYE